MGKAQKSRKFALMKLRISKNDSRLAENQEKLKKKAAQAEKAGVIKVAPTPSSLFFQYNTELGPPYQVIVDTNFINFSLQNRLEMVSEMMNCLYAKAIPCITDCVIAEIEKLGLAFRMALRVARDPRFRRLVCSHSGTYADDCIVKKVTAHRCFIVATCDRDLKRRIRKIPGVPIMFINNSHRYTIERMPDALGAPS